eukprot:Tbor_TRINITY_DN6202_c1_g1::TRINITY_DN6202_c1_g1_i4::g.1987::m.1987
MSEEQLKEIYKNMSTDEGKAFITIAWELAGRILSDIFKLRIENCREEKEGKETIFSFKFVEGKTASRENYVLSIRTTKAPVVRYLRNQIKKKEGFIFTMTKGEVGEKMRVLDLECR